MSKKTISRIFLPILLFGLIAGATILPKYAMKGLDLADQDADTGLESVTETDEIEDSIAADSDTVGGTETSVAKIGEGDGLTADEWLTGGKKSTEAANEPSDASAAAETTDSPPAEVAATTAATAPPSAESEALVSRIIASQTKAIERANAEAEKLQQARMEAEKRQLEAIQLANAETARLEQARIDAEKKQAEVIRLANEEAEKLKQARLKAEKRQLEAIKLANAETARLEAARVEAEKKQAEAIERANAETKRLQQVRLDAEKKIAELQDQSATRLKDSIAELNKATTAAMEAAEQAKKSASETTRIRTMIETEQSEKKAAASVPKPVLIASVPGKKTDAKPAEQKPTAKPLKLPKAGQIWFGSNSSKITGDGTTTVRLAAERLKSEPRLALELRAYADSVGKPEYNAILSRARAQQVLDQIVAQGVDGGRIELIPFGATVSPEGRDGSFRRVDIVYKEKR